MLEPDLSSGCWKLANIFLENYKKHFLKNNLSSKKIEMK